MITKVNTYKLNGIEAVPVTVECEIATGIGIHLVGLADIAVKESLLRTITAMQTNGYRIPGKKVVINLSPADLHKSGSGYDLPIALATIAASGQEELPFLPSLIAIGELGLDGSVRSVPGIVQAVKMAKDKGFGIIIPNGNAKELDGLFDDYKPIYPVSTMNEAIQIAKTLDGETLNGISERKNDLPDYEQHWDDIVGQHGAKRALEIAAAGGHHLLMVGPVGPGKAMLAKAMLDILPPMSKDETMEVSEVYSTKASRRPVGRPFRSPHPSVSLAAMLGGGAGENIVPGEVTLASKGILFIDQWPDMPKAMAEALRGPVEDKKITISRLKSKVDYPTDFQLVIGSYPCPCGYYGNGTDRCTCTTGQRLAYMSKLSGPVIDMVDVQVWVNANLPNNNDVKGESAAVVAERVARARARQIERQGRLNGALTSRELPELGENSKDMAENIMSKMGFSARAWSRMLKIARTIADLDDCEAILPQHIAEAASFRFLDRMDK